MPLVGSVVDLVFATHFGGFQLQNVLFVNLGGVWEARAQCVRNSVWEI